LDISQILRNFLPQFGAPKICTRVQISPCSPPSYAIALHPAYYNLVSKKIHLSILQATSSCQFHGKEGLPDKKEPKPLLERTE